MKAYATKHYIECPIREAGVIELPVYFKTMSEVKKWFCLATTEDSEQYADAMDEVELNKSLWRVEIDGEASCYVGVYDVMRYADYLSYYGHKVVITNQEDEP